MVDIVRFEPRKADLTVVTNGTKHASEVAGAGSPIFQNAQNNNDLSINSHETQQREAVAIKLKQELGVDLPKKFTPEELKVLNPQQREEYFKQEEFIKQLQNPAVMERFLKEQKVSAAKKLRESLNQSLQQQGWIGKSWNWFKNKTSIGAGSDKTMNIINRLEKGEITVVEAQQALHSFNEGQKLCADIFSDIVSGVAAVGIYTAAIAFSPFTGGTSIAAGLAIATVAAGGIKTGLKYSDAKSGGQDYTSKNVLYDMATGGFSGILAPITGGIGGATAKTLAAKVGVRAVSEIGKSAVKGAAKTTAQSGFKAFMSSALRNPTGYRYLSSSFMKKGLLYGTEFAVDGAIGGGLDGAFRASLNGENVLQAYVSGTVGGLVLAPVLGGSIKLSGKVFTAGTAKLLGKHVNSATDEMADALTRKSDNLAGSALEMRDRLVQRKEMLAREGIVADAAIDDFDKMSVLKSIFGDLDDAFDDEVDDIASRLKPDVLEIAKKRNLLDIERLDEYDISELSEFPDALWAKTLERKLLDIKQGDMYIFPNTIEVLAKLSDDEWQNVLDRGLIGKINGKYLDHSELVTYAKLSADEYKNLLDRNLMEFVNMFDIEQIDMNNIAILSKIDDETFAKLGNIETLVSDWPSEKLQRLFDRKLLDMFEEWEFPDLVELTDAEWQNALSRNLFAMEYNGSKLDVYEVAAFARLTSAEWTNVTKNNLKALTRDNKPINALLLAELAQFTKKELDNLRAYNLLELKNAKGKYFDNFELRDLAGLSKQDWKKVQERKLLDLFGDRALSSRDIRELSALSDREWKNVVDRNLLSFALKTKEDDNVPEFIRKLRQADKRYFDIYTTITMAKLTKEEWDILIKNGFLTKEFAEQGAVKKEITRVLFTKAKEMGVDEKVKANGNKIQTFKSNKHETLKIVETTPEQNGLQIRRADTYTRPDGVRVDYTQAHSNNGGAFWKRIETNPDGSQKIVVNMSTPAKVVKNADGSTSVAAKSSTAVRIETDIQYTSQGNITRQNVNGKIREFESVVTEDTILIRDPQTKKIIQKMNYSEFVVPNRDVKPRQVCQFLSKMPANELHDLLQNKIQFCLDDYDMLFHRTKAAFNHLYKQVTTYDSMFVAMHEAGHAKFQKFLNDKKLIKIWEAESKRASLPQALNTAYFGKFSTSPNKNGGLNEICAELNAIINASQLTSFGGDELGIRAQQLMEVYPQTCQRIIELLYK